MLPKIGKKQEADFSETLLNEHILIRRLAQREFPDNVDFSSTNYSK